MISDTEISDVVARTVFWLRDDRELTAHQIIDIMHERGMISSTVYAAALRQKGLQLKLGSVPRFYLQRMRELWEFHMGTRPRDYVLRLDGHAPISDRYLQLIEKYAPVWKDVHVLV